MPACIKHLRTDFLPGADSGGKWFFMGASATPDLTHGVLLGDSFQDPTNTYTAGNIVINGPQDNPTFDTTGLNPTEGLFYYNGSGVFYHYEYVQTSDPSCTAYGDCFPVCDISRIVIELIPERCPGADVEVNICEGQVGTLDFRLFFQAESPCGIVNKYKDLSGSLILSEITLGGTPLANGVGGITMTSPGTQNQKEYLDLSTLTAGTYEYVNTVNLLNDYPVDCTTCSENPSTATITINVTPPVAAGVRVYDPYLVVCEDPDCSAELSEVLTGYGTSTGTLTYEGQYLGGSLDSPTLGAYTLNLGTQIGAGAVNYASITAGTEFLPGVDIDTLTLYLDLGTPYITYAFKYVVNEDTPCPDEVYFYLRMELTGDAGSAANVEDCYWPFFENNYPGEDYSAFPLFNFLTGTPDIDGVWTVTRVSPGTTANDTTIQAALLNAEDGDGATFNFASLLDGLPNNSIKLIFTYTANSGGAAICGVCPIAQTSFTINLRGNCDQGTTVYNGSPSFYICSACVIPDAGVLLTGADDCGTWSPNSPITGLVITGSGLHAQLDFSAVATGYYTMNYDTSPGLVGSPLRACGTPTQVLIQVVGCEDCNQTVTIANFASLKGLRFDDGEVYGTDDNPATPGDITAGFNFNLQKTCA